MLPLLFTGWAHAQDAVGANPAPTAPIEGLGPDDPYDEEIIVWGEHAVRQARAAVVRKMEAFGWRARERDGDTVFRPPESWMGKARLSRDGTLWFSDPMLALESFGGNAHTVDPGASVGPEDAREASASLGTSYDLADQQLHADPGATSQAVAAVGLYVAPNRRIVDAAQGEVLSGVDAELRRYRAVLWETRVREQLEALADRLDGLWTDGVPLEGDGPPLADAASRRQAALTYWATRSDTEEGRAIRDATRIWLRETVMDSADPVTAEEQAAAEAVAGTPLDLVPPGP